MDNRGSKDAGRPYTMVATELNWQDRLGTTKVRAGLQRMHYSIEPGLYAVGTPTADSPVFVSANYKLSFDYLRRELKELTVG